ncbi:tyrosine-type recombinase/integrase [Arcobacteraceae bacterium]|nr:tyrosine-type recombinase/integrase [Arcobacteraceae bacterium]
MPKVVIPLNDKKIKESKLKDKDYTLSDGHGLQLLVKKNGSKLWEFRYTSPTTLKRRKTSFGTYPQTSLAAARKIRNDYIDKITNGIDPLEQKIQVKNKIKIEQEKKVNTFYKVSQGWLDSYENEVSENYHIKLGRALENYVYPFIKKEPIDEVTRLELLTVIDDLKSKNLLDTAKRVLNILNKVFLYAVTYEYAPHNIIADIDKKIVLGKIERKHYPTFTKKEDIKNLLLSIDNYDGNYSTKMALKVLPYLFVRSFNIRHMDWSEIDFEEEQWVIPFNKMKMKDRGDFLLPLPEQVIEMLSEVINTYTGAIYVFPSLRGKDNPMSDNTLISALRRMGYSKEEFVPHSFRSMFSTIAYENQHIHGFSSEVIEALLAHTEKNKVKGAYNRAKYNEPMKKLIQWYANYLDDLKYDRK